MTVRLLFHIANIIFLVSLTVKEIFVLRFLAVISGLFMISFHIFKATGPDWEPICWGCVYMTINVVQIVILFRERRPVILADEDYKIYRMGFGEFSLKQFQKLLKVSRKRTVHADECIVKKGDQVGVVMFITSGTAQIEQEGDIVGVLEKGKFIGEVNYLTDTPCRNRILTREGIEMICWDQDPLDQLFMKDPELRASWQSMFSARLAERLNQTQVSS